MYEQRREAAAKQQGGDLASMVVDQLVRAVWAGRVELALLAPSAGLFGWLVLEAGWTPRAAGVVAVAGWVPLLAWRGSREWLWRRLRRASVRRNVLAAFRTAGVFQTFQPRVLKVRELPGGDAVTLELPGGGTAGDVEKSAGSIASALQVREVRVTPESSNARRCRLLIVRRDWLAEVTPLGWPWTDKGRVSLWEPFPVGVGDDGAAVSVRLIERNLLNGGEPGGGKSGNVNLVCAACALDPDVDLRLLDGKQVELAAWRGCATESVGVSVTEANDMLRRLRDVMDHRYSTLLATGKRKVERGDGLGLVVVVCDELAHYLTNGTKDERGEFADLMRDLVSRGRAAGIIVVAATQKPSSDVIPTALRDLFGYRWAMRCTTPQASDTILGAGWASLGYSAHNIDPAARGVGWLLHEGGEPVRLRSYWLDDPTIRRIAARGEALRGRPPRKEAS